MEVPENDQTIQSILRHYYGNIDFTLQSIIHKDSLAFTDDDRTLLAAQTAKVPTDDVIIIHGRITSYNVCYTKLLRYCEVQARSGR